MIPFPVKALKLLIGELRSEPSGLRSSDIIESKSDDGVGISRSVVTPDTHLTRSSQEEDWTDEESLAASDTGRGGGAQREEDNDMLEMLYGSGVPPELLTDSAANQPSVDQIDDDERMKDPLVLVDVRVSLGS